MIKKGVNLLIVSPSRLFAGMVEKKGDEITCCEVCKFSKRLCRFVCKYRKARYEELIKERRSDG